VRETQFNLRAEIQRDIRNDPHQKQVPDSP